MNSKIRVNKIVESVLKDEPRTRSDDFLLVKSVWTIIKPTICDCSYGAIAILHEKYKLPGFETITRARRDLQRKNIDLRACDDMRRIRAEEEELYKNTYER